MSEATNELFSDVKKFEKYQAMLKKSVHLDEAKNGEYALKGFPNARNFHRVINILSDHEDGLTNVELVFNYDFKPSELRDGIRALIENKLATSTEVNGTESKIQLTAAGREWAAKLAKRHEEIAEEAYKALTPDEQVELDVLIKKLIADYEQRDVNYTDLSALI